MDLPRLEWRVNGISYHMGDDRGATNELNWGLGASYYWKQLGSKSKSLRDVGLYFEADLYLDSTEDFGYLFGVSAQKRIAEWLECGLLAGLVHEDNLEEKYGLYLHPIAYPFLQTRFNTRVNARLSYVPPVRNGGLIALQFLIAFD